ncbi:MAG: Hpt domain-containing protein [Chromatiaceae bacterium]|nr:Hpt domain-containing protein [Chromatiaceae bacterium]
MTLDLKQFQGIFFEESFEGLDAMESALVAAAGPILDTDVINALFRAAHSMKGGSGTFGYADLTRFTHRMEALLDQVRQGSRPLDETLIAVLLQAVDAARDLLKVLSAGGSRDPSTWRRRRWRWTPYSTPRHRPRTPVARPLVRRHPEAT